MNWDNANEAFGYFTAYVNSKGVNRCQLTLQDLVFASNFKGGNAAITEPICSLQEKTPAFSDLLEKIDNAFGSRPLESLQPRELTKLIQVCNKFFKLSEDPTVQIRGLKSAVSSAVLAAHFPRLIPVIDRRVLHSANKCGAKIKFKLNSQKQVIQIEKHFRAYIKFCYRALSRKVPKLTRRPKTLRELDRMLFVLN